MNNCAHTYWTAKVRQHEQRVRDFADKENFYRMVGLTLAPAFHIQARHAAKKYDVALRRLENARA